MDRPHAITGSKNTEGPLRARLAEAADSPAIVEIYNQGIEARTSTFETRPRTAEDIAKWFDGVHPVVVVEDGDGTVIAFASTSAYSTRACYSGIAEASLYVGRDHRRRGAGRIAVLALMDASAKAGYWKLISRIFSDNLASLALCRSLGFREVGVHQKHARLDDVWKDVVVVERLLGAGGK